MKKRDFEHGHSYSGTVFHIPSRDSSNSIEKKVYVDPVDYSCPPDKGSSKNASSLEDHYRKVVEVLPEGSMKNFFRALLSQISGSGGSEYILLQPITLPSCPVSLYVEGSYSRATVSCNESRKTYRVGKGREDRFQYLFSNENRAMTYDALYRDLGISPRPIQIILERENI